MRHWGITATLLFFIAVETIAASAVICYLYLHNQTIKSKYEECIVIQKENSVILSKVVDNQQRISKINVLSIESHQAIQHIIQTIYQENEVCKAYGKAITESRKDGY